MYVKNGIAYAGDETLPIRVLSVKPLEQHKMLVKFVSGEIKMFDFKPLLNEPCFLPLQDQKVFERVYVEFGCPVWNDGDIDIAPEYIYNNGISANC